MRWRANILFLVMVIALAPVSCQQTQPVWPVAYVPPAAVPPPETNSPSPPFFIGYSGPIYGTPGTNSIRVLIGGYSCEKKGLYYLEQGATLDTAIILSGNLNNPFGDRAVIEHLDKSPKRRYNTMDVQQRRKVILHDGDRINIIGSLW
jgi:hypothetical protein